jgi:16S rRNA (cytosine967-C5)-methyltransferase
MPNPSRRLPQSIQTFVDVALEWRHAGEPLRRVLQRHGRALHAVSSSRRRLLEDWLFAYARGRDAIEARVERVVASLPVQARRPDTRDRLLLAYALLGDDEARAQARDLLEPRLAAALDAELRAHGLEVAAPSLPPAVAAELAARLGDEGAAAATRALLERAAPGLRVRPGRPIGEVLAALAREGVHARAHPRVPGAIVVDGPLRLEALSPALQAAVEVQDAASQLAVQALAVQSGLSVVDTCAGGGGKALAIVDALAGRGRLLLLDLEQRRLDKAARRVQPHAAGLDLTTLRHDGREPFSPDLLGQFDRALVDAPCSGLGTVRRHPDLLWRYDDDAIEGLARDQAQLVRQAARLLRPGGRLLYTTCSLRQRENEAVVDEVLGDGALRPLPLATALGPLADALGATGHTLTLWPHLHDSDGFFLALLARPAP